MMHFRMEIIQTQEHVEKWTSDLHKMFIEQPTWTQLAMFETVSEWVWCNLDFEFLGQHNLA